MSRNWNWNTNQATNGPVYEVLTAEYCPMYKRVLVHRDKATIDLSRRWRYHGNNGSYIEWDSTTVVVAFRTAEVTGELEKQAIEAHNGIMAARAGAAS